MNKDSFQITWFRRLYGRPIEYLLEFIRSVRTFYSVFLLDWNLTKAHKPTKKMRIIDFFTKDIQSKNISPIWNSSLEDVLLKNNYEYSIDKRKKKIKFMGKESDKRWNNIKKKLEQLKLIDRNDYIIDLGCSTGGFVNGLATVFGCKTIGIDIDTDDCLAYAKKFKVRNVKFQKFSIQNLFKIVFDKKFKLVIFTYQSHGDDRWLRNGRLQSDFFNWLKYNCEFVLMDDPRKKMAIPKAEWFREIDIISGGYSVKYPLKIYNVS